MMYREQLAEASKRASTQARAQWLLSFADQARNLGRKSASLDELTPYSSARYRYVKLVPGMIGHWSTVTTPS
jgi:hypothetical protein